MHLQVTVPVNASKHDVWQVVADIENAANTISAIDKIEVLEKPSQGLVGLKWRETRTLFGKTATETMCVTNAVEDQFYSTEARSHGAVYKSRIQVSDKGGTTLLSMDFDAEPNSFGAKLLSATIGVMFKNATKKALLKDLEDVKAAAEKTRPGE